MEDADLTETGFDETGSGKALLLACGALARELIALRDLNGWSHMDLHCLPAILHNTPHKIPDAVEAAVKKFQTDYDQIFVVYADCGTGGELLNMCNKYGLEMIEGPHCYSFFETNEIFAGHLDEEVTAFYLTDFLARQFDAFVTKPLGLDRHPDLRDMYFGNYEKVVYLAQTDNPELTQLARDAAKKLGLNFERRFTGYGDLATALEKEAMR